jgi:hypothetical protein
MADKATQRLYMLVAGATNLDDFTNLLRKLADDVVDVRTTIPDLKKDDDTIILRKAIHSYLTYALDTLRKTRNNVNTSPVEEDE